MSNLRRHLLGLYCQICPKKTTTTEKQQAEEMWLGKETQGMDTGPVEICVLVWWVQIWAVCFLLLRLCAMQKRWMDGLYMHGCHWSMGEEVLVGECFAECTLNQHGSHSSDMPSQQTSRLSGVLTKEDSDDLASKVTRLNPIEIFLGSDWRRSKGKGHNKKPASLVTSSRLLQKHFRWTPPHAHSENANQECVESK